jgi:hypothetical protein
MSCGSNTSSSGIRRLALVNGDGLKLSIVNENPKIGRIMTGLIIIDAHAEIPSRRLALGVVYFSLV